jgi:hypothetical protein
VSPNGKQRICALSGTIAVLLHRELRGAPNVTLLRSYPESF